MIFSEASGGGQVCVQVLGDMFTRSVPVMVSFEDGSAVGELSLLIDEICLHLFCYMKNILWCFPFFFTLPSFFPLLGMVMVSLFF